MASCGKPGFRLDGECRRTARCEFGRGQSADIKIRCRRPIEGNCLIARIGDGYGLRCGRGRIALRRSAKIQLGRVSGNAVTRRNIGGYLDFQLAAYIPRRVLYDDVNILCALRKGGKGNGLLGCIAISTRPAGINVRLSCTAFHDCIVIAARFVAGKLHRRGSIAGAGRAASCQCRGGGIAGNVEGNCFKRAGIVGQLGIVFFTAVVLLAEYSKGIATIGKIGGYFNSYCSAFGSRLRNSSIIFCALIVRDNNGDIFIRPGGRPCVIQRNGIAGLAAGGFFRYAKIAASV